LQKKWDSTGFLEGLSGHTNENWAQLFESPSTASLKEWGTIYETEEMVRQSWFPRTALPETRLERWKREWREYKRKAKNWFDKYILRKKQPDFVVFPLIKRVAAQTIGHDLVSVVPMNLPVGNLFFLDMFTPYEQHIIFLFEDL
tara:strand:+ start:9269 stop:9700 length:432 start_codon:yes stop_codon:yes gene_type:complete